MAERQEYIQNLFKDENLGENKVLVDEDEVETENFSCAILRRRYSG